MRIRNGESRRQRLEITIHPEVLNLVDIVANYGKSNRSEVLESAFMAMVEHSLGVKGVGD